MPIVQVTALPQPQGSETAAVASAIVLAVSRDLDGDPSGTWVTWRTLEPGHYREGLHDAPPEQPPASHPPIVRVNAFEGRPAEVVARVLEAVAMVVADGLRVERGNVVVTWDELRAGFIHIGGGMPGT